MGSNDEFGPDTETIRAWLDKRATYAKDARVTGAPRGGSAASTPPPVTRVDGTDAGRSVLDALGVGAPPEPPSRIAQVEVDSIDLGRSVVDALRADAPAPRRAKPTSAPKPAPKPAVRMTAPPPEATVAAEPRPALPPLPTTPPEVRRGRWTEPEDNLTAVNASTDADFPGRGGVRRTLSIVLLAVLVATGVASYAAATSPTTATIGVAATLGFLLLVVWAVRAGSTTTQLSIRRGQLTIRRNGQSELVDVGAAYTPIAIVGEPGERRWTVLIERDGLPLVVITRHMVDPHWFTTVLYRLRPELRP
jgi:hypothetical protein